MTRKNKLKTIDNHVKAINRCIVENNLKIPAIIKIFLTRIEQITDDKFAKEMEIKLKPYKDQVHQFNIH